MEWPVGYLFKFCQYVLFQLDHLEASCLYVMMSLALCCGLFVYMIRVLWEAEYDVLILC